MNHAKLALQIGQLVLRINELEHQLELRDARIAELEAQVPKPARKPTAAGRRGK